MNTGIRLKILCCCLLSIIFPAPISPLANTLPEALPASIESFSGIRIEQDRITLDLSGVSLKKLLVELSRQFQIQIDPGSVPEARIDIRLENATLEQVFERLFESRAITYRHDRQTGTFQILRIDAFQAGAHQSPATVAGNLLPPEVQETAIQSPHQLVESSDTIAGKPNEPVDALGRPLYRPGQLLIKAKAGIPADRLEALHRQLGSEVLSRNNRTGIAKIGLANDIDPDDAIRAYTDSGLVEVAQRHAVRYPDQAPDDPLAFHQWALPKMQVPEAWDYTTGSNEVVVAVIDTGFDYNHPDLAANIWGNAAEIQGTDGVDDDGNNYIDDIRGWDFAGFSTTNDNDQDNDPIFIPANVHGTHVAGIIAAHGNNATGVAGLNWHASLMLLKVQADDSTGFDTMAVIEALYYAMDNGARIVNCSFGGGSFDHLELEAFRDLRDHGVLAACAAGNASTNLDQTPSYPASYNADNIMAIAASGTDDQLYSQSNFGATTVDLMAPGVDIYSTVPPDGTAAGITVDTGTAQFNRPAFQLEFSKITDANGVTATVYLCGSGGPGDFPPAVNGNIALIERGGLFFSEKATNAKGAGAIGAIIYNNVVDGSEGNWTLGSEGDWLPVVAITNADGLWLQGLGNVQVTITNVIDYQQGGYTFLNGTSMATPQVSGTAALMLALDPGQTYATIKSRMLASVDPVPAVAGKLVSGGRLNVLGALETICSSPSDSDNDGICDDVDRCQGNDASGDTDNDGVCDDRDPCPADNPDDSDDDGICNSADLCQGNDASGDTDNDGVCDNIDPCPADNPDDSDGDGICNNADLCQGNDASGDIDSDGVCDNIDPCPVDNPDDSDGDGICNSADLCQGNDASGDTDNDGTCDDLDPVVGARNSGGGGGGGGCFISTVFNRR